jgi:hypothetical protein
MVEREYIESGPTKDFFISMLVRDIYLKEAIIELIDNSIDGARLIRANYNFENLYIHITFDRSRFIIEDNCGGISLDVAKNYAFKFGREANTPKSGRETTGIFGIGMKRALFKMGRFFEIESTTVDSSFSAQLDIDAWKNEAEWRFPFTKCEDGLHNGQGVTGTTITVSKLYPDIAMEFEDSNFSKELINHVQRRVGFDINSGLAIEINGVSLTGTNVEMILTEDVKPISIEYEQNGVSVKIRAGIAPKSELNDVKLYTPSEAGWYIYCNRRLVVVADKTSLTTWKDIEDNSSGVLFHHYYAGFRGVVLFHSTDPEALPWNTTKTGLDANSLIYVSAREKMTEAFHIVKGFIDAMRNAVRDESDETSDQDAEEESENASVASAVASYPSVVVTPENKEDFKENRNLSIADLKMSTKRMPTINYKKSEEEIKRVKEMLHAKTNREVGEKTFEYYLDAEC